MSMVINVDNSLNNTDVNRFIYEDDIVCSICLAKFNDKEICRDQSEFISKKCDCEYKLHKHCITEWVNKSRRTKCLMCPELITLNESWCRRLCRFIIIKKCLINRRICMLAVSFLMRLWLLNSCVIIVYHITIYTYQFNRMSP